MLSPEQLEFRKTGVGASDAWHLFPAAWEESWAKKAAAKGLAGPDYLHKLKTGQIGEKPGNPAMRAGSHFERCILELYADESGLEIDADQDSRRHPEIGHILATPDSVAWTLGEPESEHLLEVKCVSWHGFFHNWGDEEPPKRVQIQCQQQMAVTGHGRCEVLAMVSPMELPWARVIEIVEQHGPYDEEGSIWKTSIDIAFDIAKVSGAHLQTYSVPRDDEFIRHRLIPELGKFWKGVQDRVPPPATSGDSLAENF